MLPWSCERSPPRELRNRRLQVFHTSVWFALGGHNHGSTQNDYTKDDHGSQGDDTQGIADCEDGYKEDRSTQEGDAQGASEAHDTHACN